MTRRIVVIATGGTIACAKDASGALVPTHNAADLLSRVDVPEVEAKGIDHVQLDSSAITLAELDGLLARMHTHLADDSVDGVVVTHGTDSMEDTAMAMELFRHPTKPIILTGAQRPFDDETGDGPANLTKALRAAAAPDAQGVRICFGGKLVPAFGARKIHTSADMAFAAPDLHSPAPLQLVPLAGTKVAVIAAYPGATGDLVDAAVEHGYQGLVIEALGSGNMPPAMGRAVSRALDAGVAVIVTTRVPDGEIALAYGGEGGGASLGARGAVGSGLLRAGQSRMLLVAALATGTDVNQLL